MSLQQFSRGPAVKQRPYGNSGRVWNGNAFAGKRVGICGHEKEVKKEAFEKINSKGGSKGRIAKFIQLRAMKNANKFPTKNVSEGL